MRMTEWPVRFFWLGIFGLLVLPAAASTAELNFQSDTLFRAFERDTATEKDASVLPVYEYLKIDVNNISAQPGLAFHLNGWGRWDMADNDYFNDATTGELLYGYLEYSHPVAHFNARLGRQQVFEGVADEAVDGLRLSSDLGRYFSGSLYVGQPVALDEEEGRSGDSIFGFRLANHLTGLYDLGISYKKARNDSNDAEEKTGVDLSAYLPYGVNFYGYSTYNLDTDDWGEHTYELKFAIGPVAVRPYFQKFRYEDYFGSKTTTSTPSPFRFLADTGEVLKIGGADLSLPIGGNWSLSAKAKNYDYKVLDDTSQFFSVQATWSGEGQSAVGYEVGYMNGNTAENEYSLLRLFTYWDQLPAKFPAAFVSGDIMYVGYKQDIYSEDHSLFLSLAMGKKFMEDALELKVSGDYTQDPYFDSDVRGMLTASYHFDRKL